MAQRLEQRIRNSKVNGKILRQLEMSGITAHTTPSGTVLKVNVRAIEKEKSLPKNMVVYPGAGWNDPQYAIPREAIDKNGSPKKTMHGLPIEYVGAYLSPGRQIFSSEDSFRQYTED